MRIMMRNDKMKLGNSPAHLLRLTACSEGMYGADCKQTCHCAAGVACQTDTGICSNGACDASHFGINCQCSGKATLPVNDSDVNPRPLA